MLGGCRKFNDLDRGIRIFSKIKEIDDKDPASYVLMANIYASCGLKEKSFEIRREMEEMSIKKIPGLTFVEIGGVSHSFVPEDKDHPEYEQIMAELDKLMEEIKRLRYNPDISVSTRNDLIEDHEKEAALCLHSKKIAMAFAFLHTPPGTPITIANNLWVCKDCHEATKYISKARNCEITVRDQKVFHKFKDGKCPCEDFW